MQTPSLSFGFVNDGGLLSVLEEYYRQTRKAAEVESYLGVIVGCGAVAEGLLTWALLRREDEALKSRRAPKDRQGEIKQVREWGLTDLINVSADLEVIGKTAKQASWALKDFRNFIHPYNVLQQSARPDQALAMSALAALNEIQRSLEGRLSR